MTPTRCRSGNFQQIFWSSGVDLNKDFVRVDSPMTWCWMRLELPPHEKAVLSLQLPAQFHHRVEPVPTRAIHSMSG